MGVLPFFHSFGYTFPLWLIASGEPGAVYHFNPGRIQNDRQAVREV